MLPVGEIVSSQVGHHLNYMKWLDKMSNNTELSTGTQLDFDLNIAAEREVDGVGMGVLRNGTPFLTLRGLARMCGVPNSVVVRITAQWQDSPLKPREQKIRELVRVQGADDAVAFIALMKNGTIHHAVPAAVCMAVLEYYAFEAKGDRNDHAARSYRTLARKGFNEFIYAQVGYNPSGAADVAWNQFHDRVSLTYHSVPDGYFSVFKEMADLYVTLLRGGADLGTAFFPDISVGMAWSKHWTSNNLDVIYGDRVKYEHNYPLYFPQAASNPQAPYCYPDDALAEFRQWIKKEYIANRMPRYLDQKIKEGRIPAPAARAALDAFGGPKGIAPK